MQFFATQKNPGMERFGFFGDVTFSSGNSGWIDPGFRAIIMHLQDCDNFTSHGNHRFSSKEKGHVFEDLKR